VKRKEFKRIPQEDTLEKGGILSLRCKDWLIDWLIDYLRFYVSLKIFSLIWRRHHCQLRATKIRSLLGAQGLWAGRDLYRAIPAVNGDLSFPGLIRRTAPLVASYDARGDVEDLF
jgi:hypothetical protein